MADGGDLRALQIGSDTFYPSYLADGLSFHFKTSQNQFLIAHQKTKSVEIAAQMVGKDLVWAQNFLSSKKFKKFVMSTMASASVRNGMTVEWWYQFAKWCTDGYKEHYEYTCEFCQFSAQVNTYEAESTRNDNLEFEAVCNSCYKSVTLNLVREEFKPSREQVEAWKEAGSRILPKVERVHHQFEESTIVFESSEEAR